MRRLAGWGLALPAAANVAVVVVLWLRAGGLTEVSNTADAFTSAGRITGLLGAYLVLVEILLLGRIPLLERLYGFGRLATWHARNGRAAIGLLIAHASAITVGYTLGDRVSLPAELGRLVRGYPGVITAIAGWLGLIAVVVTSLAIVRRALRYETWYFVHLYTYLCIALAFSHQLANGTEFVGDDLARAYWTALYLAVLAALIGFRIAAPALRAARHRLRVERVIEESAGAVSVEIGGRDLGALRARPGQFFCWRFLTRDRWWESHPFSLSAAPDGRRLRITVKGVGDYTNALRAMAPGTRVVAEGPYGTFTADARRHARVALIAGGIGITPIRAMLDDMPGDPGDIAVVYRAVSAEDVVLRAELDALADRRGLQLHYVLGDHRDAAGSALLSPAHLRELVPDIAARDVYVCGPPAMTAATHASLEGAGVPRRHIVTERFAL